MHNKLLNTDTRSEYNNTVTTIKHGKIYFKKITITVLLSSNEKQQTWQPNVKNEIKKLLNITGN